MIKKYIKKIIGQNNINKIKAYKNYFVSILKRGKKIEKLSENIDDIITIENKKGHIFCGYFDINPDNPYNSEQIIAGEVSKKAVCGKDKLDICLVNYKTNNIKKISSTNAWNWQMGSRIRWSNKKNIIIYNDYIEGEYCSIFYNIEEERIIKKIPYALYDISSDEKFGLSINFDRLQRLRAGYGYSNKKDETINENVPANDGLYKVDLENGKKDLLVSYKQLSEILPESKKNQCYINHISISPNDDKVMFFFIWQTNKKPGWKATLFIFDLNTNEIKCLEKDSQVSHYAWRDNENILITGISKETTKAFYRIYNVINSTFKNIDENKLNKDGHPRFSRKFKGFYSDTYPNSRYKQQFFKYLNNKYVPLMELYHDPRMFGEKRCDLHPHYFRNSEVIALDTTFEKNKRQILIVRLKNE